MNNPLHNLPPSIPGFDSIEYTPNIAHENKYVFAVQFGHSYVDKPTGITFAIEGDPAQLLQTIIELELFKTNSKINGYQIRPEQIFRPQQRSYTDSHWAWFETHYNYQKGFRMLDLCTLIHDYSVCYHNAVGQNFTLKYQLSPEILEQIKYLQADYPMQSDKDQFQLYRNKAVVLLEKILLDNTLSQSPAASAKTFKL